jgi:predicted ABC-type transport system involved in lysophospholipase L1 biosynthesis ATPase subunit
MGGISEQPGGVWPGEGPITPLVSFKNVSKSYRDGERELAVLKAAVSFDIEPGADVGLLGERESGKSTLLRLAAGIEPPSGGRIEFDGQDITSITADDRTRLLRGPIGLVSSASWVPAPGETAIDHVMMSIGSAGMTVGEAKRVALAALDAVGVSAVGAAKATAKLSSAECAHVMLARALAREPQLLIVDEPGPMPRLSERDRFCELLRATSRERGIALLIASEDLEAVQSSEVLMSISDGELVITNQAPLREEDATVVDLGTRRAAQSGT